MIEYLPCNLHIGRHDLGDVDQRTPDRRLPASRLSHHSESLATIDTEGDSIDRLDSRHLPLDDTRVDREVNLQILYFQQKIVHA